MPWLTAVALPAAAAEHLHRLERVFRAVHSEAQAADAEVVALATADPVAIALDTLVGSGPVLGVTIRAEVGDITRCRRGAELASDAGLVPRVERSADHGWSGHITRDGSPWVRWAWVEAAMHAIKRTDRIGRWARRLTIRKGTFKARVARARVLCDDIVAKWPRSE